MSGGPRQDGFALLTVLWIVALLALATMAAIGYARRGVDGAAAAEEAARARALADAGATRAVFDLLAAQVGLEADAGDPAAGPWPVDGKPHPLPLFGGRAEVAIRDEGGLIDLNDTPEEALAAMFRAVGVEEARANQLADAVADWRDEDQAARLNGAEAEAYRRAGLAWRPRDGMFETVDELKLVLGMTPELFERVAPLLTVWAHRPEVDPDVAPLPVLLATPGMDAARAEAILALRPKRPRFSEARTFGIRAVGRSDGGGVFVREAVVRLTQEPAHPFQIFLWRQGAQP